jgi:hypothetical protein
MVKTAIRSDWPIGGKRRNGRQVAGYVFGSFLDVHRERDRASALQ